MTVLKAIEIPGQEFETQEQMFRALKDNLQTISDAKKAVVREADTVKIGMIGAGSAVKGLTLESGFVYPVINTTKFMDSHNDVHLDGIWDRSIKDVQGKIYYVANHKLEVGQVIAYPQDVKVMVQTVAWKDLGYGFDGTTQALIFKIKRDKIRMKDARDIIEEKIDIEHSVRMQYLKFSLAVNSSEPDFKAEKSNFDKHISKIVNRKRAEELGYFFAIEEAKIVKEGSMVLNGSNEATPMLLPKQTDPPGGSQKTKLFPY